MLIVNYTENNNGFKVTDNLHQRQEENKLKHEGIAFRTTTIEGIDKDSVYDIHDIMERKNSLNTFMSILESNQFDVYNLNVLFSSMRLSIEKENGDLTGKS